MSEYVTPMMNGICTLCGFAHDRRDTPEQQRGRCELAQDAKRRGHTVDPYRRNDPHDDEADRAYEFRRCSEWRRRWDAQCRKHPEIS